MDAPETEQIYCLAPLQSEAGAMVPKGFSVCRWAKTLACVVLELEVEPPFYSGRVSRISFLKLRKP